MSLTPKELKNIRKQARSIAQTGHAVVLLGPDGGTSCCLHPDNVGGGRNSYQNSVASALFMVLQSPDMVKTVLDTALELAQTAKQTAQEIASQKEDDNVEVVEESSQDEDSAGA